MTTTNRAPDRLSSTGKKLWSSVTAEYALEQHELLLLEQACRTASLVEQCSRRSTLTVRFWARKCIRWWSSFVCSASRSPGCWLRCGCRAVTRMRVRSVAVCAVCNSWVVGVRRRPPETDGLLPAELVDSTLWPLCPRYDGAEQRCTCWWARRQREYLDAGGEWPAGRELTDLLELLSRHPCNAPWDETLI